MKSINIIAKNFKLLIRSKTSAFTVLIGPLLIILLVGLVFSGKGSYELSIGYVTPNHNTLTDSFVESLEKSEFFVQEFSDEQSCVSKIEQGIIHTCIIFPQDFELNNEQRNELRFLVDYSRMNLVYKIIDAVSGILEAETEELSFSLTQALLSKINTTKNELDEDLVLLGSINPRFNLLLMDLQSAITSSQAMKLDMGEVSFEQIIDRVGYLNRTTELIHEKGIEWINQSEELIEMLSDFVDDNTTIRLEQDFGELRNETLELFNETPDRIQNLLNSIDRASSALSNLESDLNQSKQLNKDVQDKIDSAKNTLASIQSEVLELKNNLEKTKNSLESIAITRAETIVSPVNTKIEPVVLETSKITFTFPLLLVLVIMYVALLLSSTLIMFEKSSKAFFRNLITPTRPALFVTNTFITSFMIILVQTIIILGLANYFLEIPLFKNALASILIIFVTITFFIVLGMALGYLFTTPEGAIMASVVLGAVFMFLSNLVVPLESLSPLFAKIIQYNPYVLASELLRKSLLFKINMSEALPIIIILFAASVIIFFLMIIFHGLSSIRRIREPKDLAEQRMMVQEPGKILSEPKPKPKPKGKIDADNKEELLMQVADLTQAEFEDYVNAEKNKIADWTERKLKNKRLAVRLRKTTSKADMIKILEEYIKRDERRAKREKGQSKEEQSEEKAKE